MDKIKIKKYFSKIETTEKYDGYFCSVGEALTTVIWGLSVACEMFAKYISGQQTAKQSYF